MHVGGNRLWLPPGKRKGESRPRSPLFPPVLLSSSRFLNSAGPTISEPGKGYQRVGRSVQRSRVLVPLLSLARFVLGRPEFKSLATLVKSQLHFSVILRP